MRRTLADFDSFRPGVNGGSEEPAGTQLKDMAFLSPGGAITRQLEARDFPSLMFRDNENLQSVSE
jgi:hypothetical protein